MYCSSNIPHSINILLDPHSLSLKQLRFFINPSIMDVSLNSEPYNVTIAVVIELQIKRLLLTVSFKKQEQLVIGVYLDSPLVICWGSVLIILLFISVVLFTYALLLYVLCLVISICRLSNDVLLFFLTFINCKVQYIT